MKYLPIIILLLGYLVLSIWTTKRINATNVLNNSQKRLNIILTWAIPYIWALLIRKMVKYRKFKTLTKENRKSENGGFKDNWKSLTGNGMGI